MQIEVAILKSVCFVSLNVVCALIVSLWLTEHLCKKELFVWIVGLADRAVRSLVPSYPVCIASCIWNLIVSVPDHCPFNLLFIFHVKFHTCTMAGQTTG